MSEQILRQIPRQRQRNYEHNTPFPVPAIPVDEVIALADLALKDIDEALGIEA